MCAWTEWEQLTGNENSSLKWEFAPHAAQLYAHQSTHKTVQLHLA